MSDLDTQLERIRRVYQRYEGFQVEQKKVRDRIVKRAFGLATNLLDLLPDLPMERLYDNDGSKDSDYDLTIRLADDLHTLKHRLSKLEVPESPKPNQFNQWRKNQLVRMLASIAPDTTCYWHEHEARYDGAFVGFLEYALPKVGFTSEDAQAFAQRWIKLDKR